MQQAAVRLLSLLPFFFFLCAFPSVAQFTLSGKVTDEARQPLSGASVILQNTFRGTGSQPDGTFSLHNLPAGKYTLQVTYLGFEKIVQALDLQADTRLELTLLKSGFMADEVVVTATRASEKSPLTFTNVSKAELEKQNVGQDLPFLLNQTPSVVVNSDAGAGVGYTGIRIRGSDPTRVNVTVNGIPLNDAESHGVFWVNMPDFASSVENIQIQRGAGTSTNGAGAFGATVNIQTNVLNQQPYGEISNSFGSFNTRKHTVKVGSGLLNGKFVFDGRLSCIASDGYINRASSDLGSWFVSGGYYGKRNMLKINIFSGKETTYQAWNGVPESLLSTNRRYNAFTYDNQTDNYRQDHYQLFFSQEAGKFWNLNTALHYTKGKGYYEEYKTAGDAYGEGSFAFYGIPNLKIGDSTITSTDLVRRLWLDNDFYGIVYSANYDNRQRLNLTFGGGWNEYKGRHYGELVWARFAGNTDIRHRYYEDEATKRDFNFYGKVLYQATDQLNGYLDLQYRRIGYRFLGINQAVEPENQDIALNFFNPKAGLTWVLNNKNTLYASYSVAHREPNRDDYVQNRPQQQPLPETLHNVEAGWKFQHAAYSITANYFLMQYKNQLVLTGQINDVGGYKRTNIPNSFRSGIEVQATVRLAKKLNLSGNLTLSENKVRNFQEFVGDSLIGSYRLSDISFSPNVIASGNLAYVPVKGLTVSWITKYVGSQFLDNTSNESRKLDAFFVNNILFNYTLTPKFMKEIRLTLLLNNIFNRLYQPNGYTFSYLADSKLVTQNYYYPQAGFNLLTGLTLKF